MLLIRRQERTTKSPLMHEWLAVMMLMGIVMATAMMTKPMLVDVEVAAVAQEALPKVVDKDMVSLLAAALLAGTRPIGQIKT